MTALLADPVPAPSARPVPVRPGRSDRGASARRPVAVPPREWAHVPRAAAIPVGVEPAASIPVPGGAIERMRGVPILVLTTESAPELKARAREAGATGWIVKPFDPGKLVKTVQMVTG